MVYNTSIQVTFRKRTSFRVSPVPVMGLYKQCLSLRHYSYFFKLFLIKNIFYTFNLVKKN